MYIFPSRVSASALQFICFDCTHFWHAHPAEGHSTKCSPDLKCLCCALQPNIEKKDNPENWRNREAATFAFSSILEGPSYASLAGVVNAGLGFLLNATKDPDPMVRQTTAWTIGTHRALLLHLQQTQTDGKASTYLTWCVLWCCCSFCPQC